MQPQLIIPIWLSLSIETRAELKKIFSIPRSEGSHIQDNEVISDGHTHPDLAHVTVEKMQEHLGSKEKDFYVLFDKTLEKIAQPEKIEIPVIRSDEPEKLKVIKKKIK